VTYFDQQNAKIDAGELEAEKIVVSALMINKFVMLFLFIYHGISDECRTTVAGSTPCSSLGYALGCLE